MNGFLIGFITGSLITAALFWGLYLMDRREARRAIFRHYRATAGQEAER